MCLAVLLLAASVALAAGAAASPKGSVQVTLAKPRVCGSTAFSRKQGRCTKDERATPIVSNRISCSIDVTTTRPVRLSAWFKYGGEVIPWGTSRVPRGSWTYWIAYDIKINLPVPGGAWECGYSVGTRRATTRFTSGGPVGDVVNAAACRRERTIPYGEGFRTCLADESAAPMAATDAVFCQVELPNVAGKVARLVLVSNEEVLEEVSFEVEGVLWFGYVFAQAPSGQRLPAGRYACRYYLDGALVAEKPFELLG